MLCVRMVNYLSFFDNEISISFTHRVYGNSGHKRGHKIPSNFGNFIHSKENRCVLHFYKSGVLFSRAEFRCYISASPVKTMLTFKARPFSTDYQNYVYLRHTFKRKHPTDFGEQNFHVADSINKNQKLRVIYCGGADIYS